MKIMTHPGLMATVGLASASIARAPADSRGSGSFSAALIATKTTSLAPADTQRGAGKSTATCKLTGMIDGGADITGYINGGTAEDAISGGTTGTDDIEGFGIGGS